MPKTRRLGANCITTFHRVPLQDGDTKPWPGDTRREAVSGVMHALSTHMKEQTMTRYLRTALGAIAAIGVVLAATAAIAHSGAMQGGMGGETDMHHHGMHGRMSDSEHGGGKHMGGAQQLMTPAEREALHEKMRAARTPEDRQALAAATRAEMEKRAKERGIALPDHRGGGGGMSQGPGAGAGGHQH